MQVVGHVAHLVGAGIGEPVGDQGSTRIKRHHSVLLTSERSSLRKMSPMMPMIIQTMMTKKKNATIDQRTSVT